MGFRFRRSFRLMPGVRINLSKSGVSTSIGGRGAWFTVGPRGARTTVGIPGTGLSYTSQSAWRKRARVDPAHVDAPSVPVPSSAPPAYDPPVTHSTVAEPQPDHGTDWEAPTFATSDDRHVVVIVLTIVAVIAVGVVLWAAFA
jgi:hypothetical protein